MPASPLVKFMNEKADRHGPLFWGRADLDGAPFRGSTQMLLTGAEMEERLVKVFMPYARIFDMSEPRDTADYLRVLDEILNQRSMCLFVQRVISRAKRSGRLRVRIYMEWATPEMRDSRPQLSQSLYGEPSHGN